MTQHDDLRALVGILARQGAGWIREQLQAQGTLLSPVVHLVFQEGMDYEAQDELIAAYPTAALAAQHANCLLGASVREMPLDRELPPFAQRGEKCWHVEVDGGSGVLLNKYQGSNTTVAEPSVVLRLRSSWEYKPLSAEPVKDEGEELAIERTEYVFSWHGWCREDELLQKVEDARQDHVAKHGLVAPETDTEKRMREFHEATAPARRELQTALSNHLTELYRGLYSEGTQASVEAAKSLEERGVLTVKQAQELVRKPTAASLVYEAAVSPNWRLVWKDATGANCWLDTGIAMIPGQQTLPIGALLKQHNLTCVTGQQDVQVNIKYPPPKSVS